jgi:hypothetical protein
MSPTGSGRRKERSSTPAVTQVSPANRIADMAPTSSIVFITTPPWAVSLLFASLGWMRLRFSM